MKIETTISQLLKYPIKSAPPMPVESVELLEHGVAGSRDYCFYDPNNNKLLTCRREQWMFGLSLYEDGSGLHIINGARGECLLDLGDFVNPVVVAYHQKGKTEYIEMVDGGDNVGNFLSQSADRDVRLARITNFAQRLTDSNTPLGIQDKAAIHVVQQAYAGSLMPPEFNVLNLRPDIVLSGDYIPDKDIARLEVAGMSLIVTGLTERCSMPNLDETGRTNPDSKFHPFKATDDHCMGIYALGVKGRLNVGDKVVVHTY